MNKKDRQAFLKSVADQAQLAKAEVAAETDGLPVYDPTILLDDSTILLESTKTRHHRNKKGNHKNKKHKQYQTLAMDGGAPSCLHLPAASKDFCLCETGYHENFVCNYDCACGMGTCEASSCKVTGSFLMVTMAFVFSFSAFIVFWMIHQRSQADMIRYASWENEQLLKKGDLVSVKTVSDETSDTAASNKKSAKENIQDVPEDTSGDTNAETGDVSDVPEETAETAETAQASPRPAPVEVIEKRPDTRTIAIIGGGMACIATALEFKKKGYDVYILETNASIRGMWTRAFHNRLNMPLKYYSEWKLPKSFPKRPNEGEVQSYLNDFVDEQDLRTCFRFNTMVKRIIKRFKGGYAVHTQHISGKKIAIEVDEMALSTGMFTNPLVVEGEDTVLA